MRGRAATAALPALVVVALVTVVAIASTGSTPGGSGRTRPPSETLYDTLFTLFLVAIALGGVLLVYGLAQRKAIAQEVASGRYRRMGVVGYLAFFGIFTAFSYWRLSNWEGPPPPEEENELAFPDRTELPSTPPGEQQVPPYEPSVSWIPIAAVVALVLAGVVAYVISERRSRRGRSTDRELAEQLAVVLDEAVDDLRAEADPRKAIIAAYARLERVFAANGTPRLASETADEYLPRVLHDLELDPASVGRLKELYTQAKFSHHAVDPAMKDEAIEAFEHIRDELRSSRDGSQVADGAVPAPVGAAS
jgi:Domain of unknown function (DUF4129)